MIITVPVIVNDDLFLIIGQVVHMIELKLLAAPGRYDSMSVKKGDLPLPYLHLVALFSSDPIECDNRLGLVLPRCVS